jgi:putative endonuclease
MAVRPGAVLQQYSSCVSIVTSPSRTVSTWATDDLERRMWQHRHKIFRSFTADHDATRLVWFEEHRMIDDAIARETQIKVRRREKELALAEVESTSRHVLRHDWFD